MAENSTLVEKLPPIAKGNSPAPASPSAPTTPAPSSTTTTVAKKQSSVTTTPKVEKKTAAPVQTAEKKDDAVVATAVEETPPPGMHSTALTHATYYSFLADAIVWGCIGLFLFGKAFKDKAKVRFVSMATYGGMLVAVGFMFFILSKTYAGYIRGEAVEPGLGLRGFCWAVFAPVLFYVLSRVIKVPAQDKKLYLTMFGLGSGIFLFIGLSQLVGGRMEQLGLSVFPFLFSASLTMLLFMTLGQGASALRGKIKQGVSIVVFMIIGGWFLYPVINLLSHLTDNMTVYNFALNILDLVLLAGISYGLWGAMSSNKDNIVLRQSFGKGAKASKTPFKVDAQKGEEEEEELSVSRGAKPASPGAAKPSFKKPKRPPSYSNN